MGYPVNTLQERPSVVSVTEHINPTTTRTAIYVPDGAAWIEFKYNATGTATGKLTYIVPNAFSDAEAVVKLAVSGQRIPVNIGDTIRLDFSDSQPMTRVDYATDAATEAGAMLVITWGVEQ